MRSQRPSADTEPTTTTRRRARFCSISATAASNRRAIESQSVRLSANFLRPERRSDDGQTILKVA
jgi:hypothetical protein